MGRRAKLWKYAAGEHGSRVTVFERAPVGNLYIRRPKPGGGYRTETLGHRDREAAMSLADREAADLREGRELVNLGRAAVARVFELYDEHETVDKCPEQQAEDARQMKMWRAVLGDSYDLADFGVGEWNAFKRRRSAGTINPTGEPVPEGKRVVVGPRTVQKDLAFLRTVCEWATGYKEHGRPLLASNPTAGSLFEYPENPNPKREMADHDRVDAIRKHYRTPRMTATRSGKREKRESYLPELFEIVIGQGRRISAVCKLRLSDLRLEPTTKHPHGAIVWPGCFDKRGKLWRCAIDERTRAAILAARLKRGDVSSEWLFPAPANPAKPLRYETASEWLRETEREAELPPQDGTLWHAYRRLWATARKHLPIKDVAKAGGWSCTQTVELYQSADDETTYEVIMNPREIRRRA